MGAVLIVTERLILASQSPRRQELLAFAGWNFTVQTDMVDERALPDEPAGAYVCRLAAVKARAVAKHAPLGSVVLGADTAVIDRDQILGKPADRNEAVRMLRKLRGRSHQVFTALCALRVDDGRTITDLCVTDVPMRAYSEREIQAYVETGDPLDKAGAYGIQHLGFRPVESLEGCFPNVMGLPLCRVDHMLRQLNCTPEDGGNPVCAGPASGECPFHRSVLRGEL